MSTYKYAVLLFIIGFCSLCMAELSLLEIEQLQQMAYEEDPIAQIELGNIYSHSRRYFPNEDPVILYREYINLHKQAFETLKHLDKTHKATAKELYYLGMLHLDRLVAGVNFFEAYRYFEKAAYKGHAESQYKTGFIYYRGISDKTKDYQRALFWFKQSADQNNGNGLYALAKMY